MKAKQLILKGKYSSVEKNNILQLDQSLKSNATPFTYELDKTLDCANCDVVAQKIILTDVSDYPTLIHEMLHAELTCINGFPSTEELLAKRDVNFRRFSQLVSDMSNDIQHFIFYDRFRELNAHRPYAPFIINERAMRNLYGHATMENQIHGLYQYSKKRQFIEFYQSTFVKLYYNKYLDEIDITDHLQELKNAFPKLYAFFDSFFQSTLHWNGDRTIVLEAIEQFYMDVKRYLEIE